MCHFGEYVSLNDNSLSKGMKLRICVRHTHRHWLSNAANTNANLRFEKVTAKVDQFYDEIFKLFPRNSCVIVHVLCHRTVFFLFSSVPSLTWSNTKAPRMPTFKIELLMMRQFGIFELKRARYERNHAKENRILLIVWFHRKEIIFVVVFHFLVRGVIHLPFFVFISLAERIQSFVKIKRSDDDFWFETIFVEFVSTRAAASRSVFAETKTNSPSQHFDIIFARLIHA